MNIFILILLTLAFLGLFDKIIGGKLKLADGFDRGIETMGTLGLSMLGFYCIAVTVVGHNVEAITSFAQTLHMDACVILGCLLAPDLGGYSMVKELTANSNMIIFLGLVLTSTIGTVISFQLPLFLTSLEKEDIKPFINGLIYGMIVVPVMMIPLGMLMKIEHLIQLLLPVFIICCALVLGLLFLRKQTMRFLECFGEGIRILSLVLFGCVIVQAYWTSLPLTTIDLIEEGLFIVLKCSMIVSGSMILCDLVMKYCASAIKKIASFLKVNEYTVIGLFLQLATSVAMFPLFKKMDTRGKIINAAFSVSGAYVLGAQLGFVSSVTTGQGVMIYMIAKLAGGIIALALASVLSKPSM